MKTIRVQTLEIGLRGRDPFFNVGCESVATLVHMWNNDSQWGVDDLLARVREARDVAIRNNELFARVFGGGMDPADYIAQRYARYALDAIETGCLWTWEEV